MSLVALEFKINGKLKVQGGDMKLIYAQGACSLSVHIMLEELGIPYEGIKVSLQDKKVLESYNPRGYVPVLVLNDGLVMTEAISILQYLSSTHGDAFMPKNTLEKAQCIEWLTFISSEIHKGATPLFYQEMVGDEYLKMVTEKLSQRLEFMDDRLQGNAFLVGDNYTIADMYAFAILQILDHLGISFEEFSGIQEYKLELEENLIIKAIMDKEKNENLATEVRQDPFLGTRTPEGIQPSM